LTKEQQRKEQEKIQKEAAALADQERQQTTVGVGKFVYPPALEQSDGTVLEGGCELLVCSRQ